MSRISKKKLIKVLKGDIEVQPTRDTPQSVWIAGYKRWRKMMEKANAND